VPTRRTILLAASGAIAGVLVHKDASSQTVRMTEQPWSLAGLSGALTAPAGQAARGPAVLIIAGSGPTDRDGNNPLGVRADTYRLLAQALAAQGIRSLRYDKRGIAGSQKITREEDLRFDDYVDDAAAAASDLAARPEVAGVVLIGHSEGGVTAIRAASRAPVKGVILLASLGRPMSVALREQLMSAPLPEETRAQALRILDELNNGRRVGDVPPVLHALFRPSVQPFLLSGLSLDPAAELAKLSLPVLIVRAERDLQISEAEFAALATARPDARQLRLPEANHLLKQVAADRAANLAAYANPYLPLDPALVPAIVEFVRSVVP
jgi:pimeloyl-ACP methyl ester carboxylesterase